ncbi:hypothetical protein DC522_20745 [Microvirga sp. KLBC 81]|nr:hypothetical protein DC522_20745 [Microvirga sp. KLBC 81]
MNPFFVNNLDPNRFPKTTLWIHGQVPTPFGYVVPARDGHLIRVRRKPLRYPMTPRRDRVAVKVVEI